MPRKKETKPILYEMMYILDPALGEDGIEKMNATIQERLKSGGAEITKDQPWGVRRLAYEIKKRKEGYYHVLEFTAPTTVPTAFSAWTRTQASLLRYLMIRVPKAKMLQEKRDAEAAALAAQRAKEAEAARESEAASSAPAGKPVEEQKPAEPAAPQTTPQPAPEPAPAGPAPAEAPPTETPPPVEQPATTQETQTEEQPVSEEVKPEEVKPEEGTSESTVSEGGEERESSSTP